MAEVLTYSEACDVVESTFEQYDVSNDALEDAKAVLETVYDDYENDPDFEDVDVPYTEPLIEEYALWLVEQEESTRIEVPADRMEQPPDSPEEHNKRMKEHYKAFGIDPEDDSNPYVLPEDVPNDALVTDISEDLAHNAPPDERERFNNWSRRKTVVKRLKVQTKLLRLHQ